MFDGLLALGSARKYAAETAKGAGAIKGDPGRGIEDTNVVDGHLIVDYDDGTSKDAGEVGGGGGSAWIDEKDILTRQLIVDEDMELEDIESEGDVFLYDNENLAVMTDIAETTSKDVTYKVKDGLVYINGTASGSLHIYPTMVLPSWLKGCTLTAFVEVVSGTKSGTITFKTPYTYRKSDGTESQASMNTNATAKATVTSMNVNTTTVEFSVPTGAGGTNLVLKPYIAVRSADYNSMAHELKAATREAVSTTLSNKSGILMSMTADFTAHVKSKKRLPSLFGKRLVVCGDSVAYGAQGNPFGFTIAQKQNLSYENHAESGATISTYTPYKYIAGQVANLTGNYDLIICDGGYNDKAHQVALGELTTGFSAELDETTFLGAAESLCKSLITKYPNAKKLFVLIHKVASSSYVIDAGQQTYFNALITAFQKWNIPYIDLREYPLCAYNETYASTYFNPTDFASNGGVHPNNAGYALGYIDQITAKMESI